MNDLEDIVFTYKEHTAYLKINRPPNNFFDSDLIRQIADVLEEMDNNKDCRSIILYSEGKLFVQVQISQDQILKMNLMLTPHYMIRQ